LEIQNFRTDEGLGYCESLYNDRFYVDQSIVTFNSPELEYYLNTKYKASDNLKLRIVGAIPLHSSKGYDKITLDTTGIAGVESTITNKISNTNSLFGGRILCSRIGYQDFMF